MNNRDKRIELIEEAKADARANAMFTIDINDIIDMPSETEVIADHLIANGVTVGKDNNAPARWIPVSERLPENCRLVMTYNGDIDISLFECGEFTQYDENGYPFEVRHVTHWMPLPEPPKGERE